MIATTTEEKNILQEAGRRLSFVLEEVSKAVRPGATTKELDTLAERLIRERGDIPAFLNYQPRGASYPYPATLCVSVNDEVVHGVPGERVLQEGDIVGLDLGLVHEGLIVDAARTVPVGSIDAEKERLISATKEALNRGIQAARAGNRIGDISAAVEAVAKGQNLGIVRDLGGHGVGKGVHEAPFIPNFTVGGKTPKIEEGMVLAIEPMLNLGKGEVKIAKDDYTFRTADASFSAHFEDTVLVTSGAPIILTRTGGVK